MKLPKYIILMFLLAISFSGFCHIGSDSLLSHQNSSVPAQRLSLLKTFTKSFQSQSLDSCLKYGGEALDLAISLKDSSSMAELSNTLGSAYFYTAMYEKALEQYLAAMRYFKQLNDNIGMAKTYNNLGIIYEVSGKYDVAIRHYNLALEQ